MSDVLSRRGALLACAALAGAMAALALGGGFVWDDHSLIMEQAAAPDAISRAFTEAFFWEPDPGAARYYRPVVSLALALQWRLFGADPLGYHAVSGLLYVACSLLAFVWLERRLVEADGSSSDSGASTRAASSTGMLVPASLLGALAFALHPSRAQVLSWISGSTDLWAGVFALSALVLAQRSRSGLGDLAAAACAGLAVAAKETAIALPIALALDSWLRGAGTIRWRGLATMAAAPALFFVVRSQIVATPLATLWSSGLWGLSLRLIFSLGWDVAAVALPHNPRVQLNFDLVSIERLDPALAPYVWIGAATLVGLGALLLAARSRPALRGYGSDLGLFLALLAPSLNLVPIGIGTTCSERFLYLPLLGVCAAFARFLAGVPERMRVVAVPGSLALIAGCALISARETQYFVSDRALQEHFYRQDPSELLTQRKLVRIYARAGETGRARWMNQHLLQVLDRTATNSKARAANLITYALADAQLVRDDDPARLRELRDFLDASTAATGTASLRVAGRAQRIELSTALHAELAQLEGGGIELSEARVMLHARTLDLDAAEALAATLPEGKAARARVQALRARIAAYQGRFAQALSLWPVQDPKYARDPFLQALQAASATHSAASRFGPRSALAAEAVAVAELGLPARGRVLLASLRREGRLKPALVEAQLRVELAARRPDLAAQVLRAAERDDPANAGQYRAWLTGIGAR